MPLSQSNLQAVADSLRGAEAARLPIDPPSKTYPELTTDDAYQVQLINHAHAVREGKRVIGYKVGLTSREAQKHFGVFEPDFGHLFDTMALLEDSELDLSTLIQPKIEGEIAFILGKDLQGPGVTIVDVLTSVDYAVAAMEVIDSRIRDWKIAAPDTIADNGSSAFFVLAGEKRRIESLSFPHMGMALSKNGEVMLTGAGAAVLGNPLSAVAFLANELGKHNRALPAGSVVLSGALGGMLTMKNGDWFSCEIARLGKVNLRVKKAL